MRTTLIISDNRLAMSVFNYLHSFVFFYFIFCSDALRNGKASASFVCKDSFETKAKTPLQALIGPTRTSKSHSLWRIPKAARTTLRALVSAVWVPGGESSTLPDLIKKFHISGTTVGSHFSPVHIVSLSFGITAAVARKCGAGGAPGGGGEMARNRAQDAPFCIIRVMPLPKGSFPF